MNVFQKAMRFLGLSGSQPHNSGGLGWRSSLEPSFSGLTVNQDAALTLSAVWACVNRLSQTISTMPLQVFRQEGHDLARQDPQDPLHFILHDSPNADMTANEFWAVMQLSVELWGNAYAAKIMVGDKVFGLDFIRPERVGVRRLPDGRIEYRIQSQDGPRVLYDRDVLHVKGLSTDGILGLSVVGQMRHTLGIGLAMEQAAGDVFKSGLRPSGILSVERKLDDRGRNTIYQKVDDFKRDRSGGILVLELDEKFTPVSINPEDAQLLASRSWSVEEICRWFGVPPYLVGYTEKSTSWGTGMEQQNLAFLTYTILPRLRRIEQAIERSLIPANERGRRFVRFNVEGLLRADSKTRAEVNQMDVRNGIRSRNEVRAKENLAPYEGGDIFTIESNLATVERIISGEGNKGSISINAKR